MRGNRFDYGTGCFVCESCGRKTRTTAVTARNDWPVCPDCFELAGYQNGISDRGPRDAEDYITSARDHARTVYAKGGKLDWNESFWAERGARAQDELYDLALSLRAEDGEARRPE